jgi:hypothetical protein
MPTIFDDILITEEKKQSILDKSPDKMPLNPTAQGWSGQQVRAALASATFGTEDSLLSEVEVKLEVIKDHFESYVGNIVVLDALPVDLAPYEESYIFIKDSQSNITAAYYIKNGVALKVRFATNLVVQDDEPVDQVVGDLWYDIISGEPSTISQGYLSLEGGNVTGNVNVGGNIELGGTSNIVKENGVNKKTVDFVLSGTELTITTL